MWDRPKVLSTFKTLRIVVGVAPVQADAFGGDCENQSWSLGEVGKLHGSGNVSYSVLDRYFRAAGPSNL